MVVVPRGGIRLWVVEEDSPVAEDSPAVADTLQEDSPVAEDSLAVADTLREDNLVAEDSPAVADTLREDSPVAEDSPAVADTLQEDSPVAEGSQAVAADNPVVVADSLAAAVDTQAVAAVRRRTSFHTLHRRYFPD